MLTANTSNCLIIKNDGIGDLIASSGVISSVAQHFEGRLDLVTASRTARWPNGSRGSAGSFIFPAMD